MIAMATLKERLRSDLTSSMKARDELTTASLRMALTSITNEEVSGKQVRQLSDDEVLRVIEREIKKRREAATAFADGDRADRAERETAEAAVLAAYLPEQLSDDELSRLVSTAVAKAQAEGAQGPRAMGVVMSAVKPQIAGRADGGRVAAEVKRQLAQ
jgi:uncharacterized protein YqeY